MGCDIHIVLQFRQPSEKYWDTIELGSMGRNYTLFGYVAGVRSDGPPVAEQRGFPEDFDEFGCYTDFQQRCDHSRTWLSVEEMNEAIEKVRNDPEGDWRYVDIKLRYVHLLATRLQKDGFEVRYVIGFDS